MKLEKIWAIYFSGTGTTRRTVERIAGGIASRLNLPAESVDFSRPAVRQETLGFGEMDLVVFGTPVYAGRVPNVLLPFLQERIVGGGALAVPVVLFGNRNYDDALIELRNILAADGMHPIAAGAFVGEHSFSRVLGADRPNAEDKVLMDEFAARVAELAAGLDAAPVKSVAVRGQEPLRPYYTPRDRAGNPINILKVKPKTDLSRCDGCGLCADLCPMGSIDPDDVTHYTGICIKCCACVKKCPVGAKYYDDEGYLYHQHELEEMYQRRAEPEVFL